MKLFCGKATQPTTQRVVDHRVWGSATASKREWNPACTARHMIGTPVNADIVSASNGTGVPLLPLLVRVNLKTLSEKLKMIFR